MKQNRREWNNMEQYGIQCNRIDQNGIEWNSMEYGWNGMEKNGRE